MNQIELDDYRVARLKQAAERVANGNNTVFGKRLGYADGAFIRQMLSGSRRVSEKTIRAVEKLPGMRGWFDADFSKELVGANDTDADSFMPNVDRGKFQILTEAQRSAIEEWVIKQIDSFLGLTSPAPHTASKKHAHAA